MRGRARGGGAAFAAAFGAIARAFAAAAPIHPPPTHASACPYPPAPTPVHPPTHPGPPTHSYMTADLAEKEGLHVKKLSGTKFRQMLRGGAGRGGVIGV